MFPKEAAAQAEIEKCMEAIKAMSESEQKLKNSKVYKTGLKYTAIRGDYKSLIAKLKKKFSAKEKEKNKMVARYREDLPTAVNDRSDCNYFNEERIAVYTCIVGKYDNINEPLFCPDNIDYYVITDLDVPEESKWKKIDVNSFKEVEGFSPALKNRYFKINPHIVFPQYRYSIYVDGNFKIYSDMTEHVNRMSPYGFSHFRHSKRTCAYMEAEVCRALGKETSENLDAYKVRLKENGFPEDYGLLACDILVREHNRPECIKIMEQWWFEFKNYIKRDQLSLPFVLYKNGIKVDEVTTLGGDVHKEYSFEIVKHN